MRAIIDSITTVPGLIVLVLICILVIFLVVRIRNPKHQLPKGGNDMDSSSGSNYDPDEVSPDSGSNGPTIGLSGWRDDGFDGRNRSGMDRNDQEKSD